MSSIYLIGNTDDFTLYKNNPNDVNCLPLKNLPFSYFPFYYSDMENSIKKISELVSLNSEGKSIDIDTLFSLLNTLEEPYQPFNTNCIYHMKIVIFIVWFCIIFAFLKLLSYLLKENYIYFIIVSIVLILIFSVLWSLILTSYRF